MTGCCFFYIYIIVKSSIQSFFHHGFYVPYEMHQYSLTRKRHKFAYLTIENNSFARFARTFFIFGHSANVLVLSMTWNDLFCSCVDDVGIWWQMLNFVLLPLKRWFQFNSRIVRIHFASSITLNNWETLGRNSKLRFQMTFSSQCNRRRVCLSSLISSLVPICPCCPRVRWWSRTCR